MKTTLLVVGALAATSLALAAPPKTVKKPVTDTYHGTPVTDEYRWLETWSDPAVKAWSAAQNKAARQVLDRLPSVGAIKKRVTDIATATSADWVELRRRGAAVFALKIQPPKQQPFLVSLETDLDPGKENVVVDPNVIDTKGTTAIDFYVPSRDAAKVAVSMSQGGSESGTVHVYEVATGKETGDVIPRVNGGTAGGSLTWNADGSGFYYTRYPRIGERPPEDVDFFQQVYFHKLGAPVESDTNCVGKDFPRIAEIELETSADGRFVLASVANGDGGEFAHYLLGPSGVWTQVSTFADQVVRAELGPDGAMYLLSRKDAPRGKLLRLPLETPSLDKAVLIVPEGENAIQDYVTTPGFLYVVELLGGPSQLRALDHEGHEKAKVPILAVSAVGQIVPIGGDELLFRNQSYIDPPAWYRYDPKQSAVTPTKLKRTSLADYSDAEVVREMATSKDGTKVPINIIKRKGTKLDGTNPTWLYGYGGYGVVVAPRFQDVRRVWVEQGGVYAVANLRGGGEFGEAWHLGGNLTNKQNVFDDFAACARYLIDTHVTSTEHLILEGGSNGGLLMGAMLTQQPNIARAVVSHVGIYDMLRVELSPNGAFNVTEFGTVTNPDHFKALYAYSPYHHVVDGTAYPAVLFLTGENDPRVDPMQSRKMTARLQAATSGSAPILLRTSSSSGHGIGSALGEIIAQNVDVYSFVFAQLKMKVVPVK